MLLDLFICLQPLHGVSLQQTCKSPVHLQTIFFAGLLHRTGDRFDNPADHMFAAARAIWHMVGYDDYAKLAALVQSAVLT